ncbi:MAG TPA: hypothetical protein VE133_02900 [Candidatus Sulfotelmatobacter sp.]|nr:hypothetical protein [Candidatus Sulfotelmatobacter sp.]
MSRTVIIAAMEREVKPLVQGWQQSSISDGSRSFHVFERDELIVVISGIGRKHAEAASRAALTQYRPAQLVSAGVAGALIRSMKAGSVVTPNIVVDAADGVEYRCSFEPGAVVGGGVLVTADEIADADTKKKLVDGFHALVVDMEAAAVARVAAEARLDFRCIKAISDETDFVIPPLRQFVDAEGNFLASRFALWTMLRPWRWANVAELGRNSAKAANALCEWLRKHLMARSAPAEVVTLKRAELTDVVPGRR